ncbi:MAG: hypothetical protein K5930_12740 [Treponemataceae bacterium]|nr:hypothetical protein [Treponemataceae bacterium]
MCGGLAYGLSLCRECRSALLKEASENCDDRRCSVCGKKMLSEDEVCLQCRSSEAAPAKGLDGIRPVFSYLLKKKKLLYEWKIAGKENLSPFFADCLATVYKHDFQGLPLVPVPPRPGKIRTNGWDQTDSLVREFSIRYKVDVLKLLVRTSGQQQKKLGRSERLSASGQYMASKALVAMAAEKKPCHVVLLDDVMTTGSTLSHCASVLKENGIEKVSAMTLFTVPV